MSDAERQQRRKVMIKNLKSAILNLPRRGRHNVAKILCLGFGLAIGAVLIAQVYFQEADRTYQIYEEYTIDGEHYEGEKTSGGVAQGVKSYCPQVEAATRSTQVLGDALFAVDNDRKISLNAYLADSCFFDVFPQKIGQGKAKETLSRPFYCLVSHEVAGRIGGNVVGRHLTCKEYPGLTFTIGGVFDDFPYNSSLHGTDLVIALGSIGKMMYDGSERWVGNDRYRSYVRLAQGKTPADLRPNIEKMLREKIPQKELKKAGVTMDYDLKLLNDIYTGDPYVKTMSRILLLLAFVLLFSSVMNYLLIVIGNMVGRTREMAVRKCFGAGRTDIGSIVFCEAVVHIACAVVLAGLLIFVCKGTAHRHAGMRAPPQPGRSVPSLGVGCHVAPRRRVARLSLLGRPCGNGLSRLCREPPKVETCLARLPVCSSLFAPLPTPHHRPAVCFHGGIQSGL